MLLLPRLKTPIGQAGKARIRSQAAIRNRWLITFGLEAKPMENAGFARIMQWMKSLNFIAERMLC